MCSVLKFINNEVGLDVVTDYVTACLLRDIEFQLHPYKDEEVFDEKEL